MKQGTVLSTALSEYTLRERIGSGGSGEVYRATSASGDAVAIKILHARVPADKRERFRNEIYFCLGDHSPRIVRVLDYGQFLEDGNSRPFFVSTLYRTNLRRLMDAGIQPDSVLPLFQQLLDAMEAAHLKGHWHRDIKPENVLVDGEPPQLVLGDFGIAHFAEDALPGLVETRDQEKLANFQYAAPEQRVRGGRSDQRSDLYAAGLILNEMFTGAVPYGEGYRKIGSVAPQFGYLDEIVTQLIQQDPAARPSTADVVKQLLIQLGVEAVTRQRLDELKQAVVPRYSVESRELEQPIRRIGHDYTGGKLVFRLSDVPSADWHQAFKTMKNYSWPDHYPPSSVAFGPDYAALHLYDENDVPRILRAFDSWLEITTKGLAELLEKRASESKQREEAHLRHQREEEEKRSRILRMST